MRVRYECTRLASHYRYPLERTNSCEIAGFEDYQCLRRYFEKHAGHNERHPPEIVSPLDWEAAKDEFAGISLKGKLVFRPKNVGPLFQLRPRAVAGGAIMSFSTGLWRRQVPLPLGSCNHGFKTNGFASKRDSLAVRGCLCSSRRRRKSADASFKRMKLVGS